MQKTNDLEGLVCSFWNGQHKCKHKYRFVPVGGYEGGVDVLDAKTGAVLYQARDSYGARQFIRKREAL
jgi:hypothetical protein